MTVVVDLGCRTYGEDESIGPLVRRFKPRNLYGFDPLLPADEDYWVDDTYVRIERIAAWLFDGQLPLGIGAPSELDATVVHRKNGRGEWDRSVPVRCFDFPEMLTRHSPGVVVKMNVEGAEFPLLQACLDRGIAERIGLLVVAWHDDVLDGGTDYKAWRGRLEDALPCPIEPWTLDFA